MVGRKERILLLDCDDNFHIYSLQKSKKINDIIINKYFIVVIKLYLSVYFY